MLSTIQNKATVAAVAASLLGSVWVSAQTGQGQKKTPKAQGAATQQIIIKPDGINWTRGPEAYPVGVEFSILEGDLQASRPFTMRVRLPEGTRIQPHSIAKGENLTVLSGTLGVGQGSTFDTTQATRLIEGGFMAVPPQATIYGWAEEETIVQIQGMGPFEVNYANPANDPRERMRGGAGQEQMNGQDPDSMQNKMNTPKNKMKKAK